MIYSNINLDDDYSLCHFFYLMLIIIFFETNEFSLSNILGGVGNNKKVQDHVNNELNKKKHN